MSNGNMGWSWSRIRSSCPVLTMLSLNYWKSSSLTNAVPLQGPKVLMTVERVSNVDSVSAVLATCRGRPSNARNRCYTICFVLLHAAHKTITWSEPHPPLVSPDKLWLFHLQLISFWILNFDTVRCEDIPLLGSLLSGSWLWRMALHFYVLALMFPRWRHFPFSTNSVIDTWIARYWFPLLNPVDRWLSSTSSPSADIRWSHGLAKIWWTIWLLEDMVPSRTPPLSGPLTARKGCKRRTHPLILHWLCHHH